MSPMLTDWAGEYGLPQDVVKGGCAISGPNMWVKTKVRASAQSVRLRRVFSGMNQSMARSSVRQTTYSSRVGTRLMPAPPPAAAAR